MAKETNNHMMVNTISFVEYSMVHLFEDNSNRIHYQKINVREYHELGENITNEMSNQNIERQYAEHKQVDNRNTIVFIKDKYEFIYLINENYLPKVVYRVVCHAVDHLCLVLISHELVEMIEMIRRRILMYYQAEGHSL